MKRPVQLKDWRFMSIPSGLFDTGAGPRHSMPRRSETFLPNPEESPWNLRGKYLEALAAAGTVRT